MAGPTAGMAPLVGRTLGHYRILAKIGEGGMGEVYRAQDEHLDREVAIKVLPPGALADEHSRKRFRKEALALSKLNHPNIATIFDFDTQQGVDLLVMEYIPGTTVSEKLAGRPLPEKLVIALGTQLAEGLSAAHEHGVVHRDLKPGNVRLTPDGRLKILDFGLAKLQLPVTASALTESLSEARTVAGTLPYMAPEQLLGGEIDARTDIWGAGCVLFEMMTGRQPFLGFGPALTEAILHAVTPSPSALNPYVSAGLTAPILKCLEKDPENRYQSVKELAIDLRRLQTGVVNAQQPATRTARLRSAKSIGASLGIVALIMLLVGLGAGNWRNRLLGGVGKRRIESLAVLPLANLSGDPQQEYFADGMTEQLITNLGKISSLRVISRQSVIRYKGTNKPLSEIARELHVDGVVEGSVLRSGYRVRISAQLIQAEPEKHLWAESYERDLHDTLTLQNVIAGAITRQVQARVTPEEQGRLMQARVINPAALDAYLKGQYELERGDIPKSSQYFEQAVTVDPNYALAHAALAIADINLAFVSSGAPASALLKAEAAAEKSLQIDEQLAEGHAALAWVKAIYRWDWAGAEAEFQRALELNPNSAAVHRRHAWYLAWVGRFGEAIAEGRQAMELDPVSDRRIMGAVFYCNREYSEALQEWNHALQLNPNDALVMADLGRAYMQKGLYAQAVLQFEKVRALSKEKTYAAAAGGGWLGYAYALVGRTSDAQAILNDFIARSKQTYVSPLNVAMIYRTGQQGAST